MKWPLLAAALLIAAALALRVVVLSRGFFAVDDVALIGGVPAGPPDLGYLTTLYDKQFMPGGLALVWAVTTLAPYNWELAAGVLLVLQGLAGVAMYRLLDLLFAARVAVLALLALYLFTPLTVPAIGWWAAGLNAIPLQLAIPLALAAHVRYLRTGQVRHAVRAAGWALFGMAFFLKGLIIPVVLFVVTVAFFDSRTLRRHARVWIGYGAVAGLFFVVYLVRMYTSAEPGAVVPEASVAGPMAAGMLGVTFPTGVTGTLMAFGGWEVLPMPAVGGRADPGPAVVAASWLVLLTVVAVTCFYRRRAWRAWALLLGYLLVAGFAVTAMARGQAYLDGYEVGLDAHYLADVAPIWVLCLGLAALRLRGEQEWLRATAPGVRVRRVALAAVGLVVAFGTVSIVSFASTVGTGQTRAYFRQAAAELARVPEDAEIFASMVPPYVAIPWQGSRVLTNRVLGPLASQARRDRLAAPGPTARGLVFDSGGRLVQARIDGSRAEDQACLKLERGTRFFPWFSYGGHEGVTELRYTASGPARVVLELGAQRREVTLPGAVDGRFFVPFAEHGTGLRISLADPAQRFCLRGIALGRAVA